MTIILPTDKIKGRHRDRLAIVYIRQSTLQQVGHNQESTRLQYGLVDRVQQFGWAPERIVVIDDDLGCSGSSADTRPGFQRLVAEVGLGRVGIIIGAEVSRLARSCSDWYQLLEICALADTLIADDDGVCDPAAYNDRLLLGLKGTMSEAELHMLKGRLQAGRWAKARRGELFFNLPRGYVRRSSGDIALDPDEQVQATIRLVFDVFEHCRTINGVLAYCVTHGIDLPQRARSGPAKGELEWHRPNRYTLAEMLTSPAYAGAYVYGRRHSHARRFSEPIPSGVSQEDKEGMILLRDRWPAYIDWETHERICAQVAQNRSDHAGVSRGGPSLLAGLVVCGRCGLRMATVYPNGGRYLRYICSRDAINYGAPVCQSLSGKTLDALVEALILRALEPAAVEASLQLAEDIELERVALHRQWRQRLERARYEADRARRQFDAVEPENRLVARSLERQWEQALSAELTLQAEHERFLATQPMPLSDEERAAIRTLTTDIPALWQAPTTTAHDRQAIARTILDRVVVTVEGETEQVRVECHWAGGERTDHRLIRPVKELQQLSTYDQLMARVQALHGDKLKPPAIANILNAEGWRPPKRRKIFSGAMVRDLLHRLGVPTQARNAPCQMVERQGPTELTLQELAGRLAMPEQTLYRWLRRGLLAARRAVVRSHPVWLVTADETEIERLRALRQGRTSHSYPGSTDPVGPQLRLETHHG
jgi:DNA invertase Pin-like site-specific DNA recombinase